jgi:ABC-type glycerol-3-phosphate transport system permease component
MNPFQYTEPQAHKKVSPMQRFLSFLKYAILLILGASYLLPFYWMVSSALKNENQVFVVPPVLAPFPPRWMNFVESWTSLPFNTYLFNTLIKYALPVTLGTLLSSALVAYGFGRVRWRGRNIFFAICLSTMMVPFQVTMVPLFVIFRQLHWINTYLPLVIPAFFGNPYFIFLLRQFFRSIPEELSDAARIDGSSELGILFRIILPLARPALTVTALFTFMGAWNDYLGPLIYLQKPAQYTLAVGIDFLRQAMTTKTTHTALSYPYLMAVSAVITLPIVVLFFFAQRTFIEGITLTGLKG